MWFRNATIYHVENMPNDKLLAEALMEYSIKPCPPHARQISGWLDVVNGQKVFSQNGAMLFLLGKEERILPPSVLKQMVLHKVTEIEEKENRSVRRSEMNQIKEEMEFSLLPKAFTILKETFGFYDSKTKQLVINTSSPKGAEEFCSMLIKALKTVELTPLSVDVSVSEILSSIVMGKRGLPKAFTLGERCVLESPENTSKRFSCKGYELPAEEVDGLLAKGLKVTELNVTFEDRISFSLTQSLVIKGIKTLDTLQDELKTCQKLDDKIEVLDASFFLLVSELAKLISSITFELLSEDNIEPSMAAMRTENHIQEEAVA